MLTFLAAVEPEAAHQAVVDPQNVMVKTANVSLGEDPLREVERTGQQQVKANLF